jgi:hypothetical protein
LSNDDDDDDDADSTDEANLPTIRCAGCEKPLVMDANDADDRLWALRCGHMICGGCLNQIGLPLARPVPDIVGNDEDAGAGAGAAQSRRNAKGKGRQLSYERDSTAFVSVVLDQDSASHSDRITRSQAHSRPSPGPSSSSGTTGDPSRFASLRRPRAGRSHDADGDASERAALAPYDQDEAHESGGESEDDGDEYIGARSAAGAPTGGTQRRPRRTAARGSTSASIPSSRGSRGRLRGGKGRGRGGHTLRARVIRSWDYACPVAGCARVHTRVLVGPNEGEAIWKPKGDAGEIAVYT